jgi:hypothetical protein
MTALFIVRAEVADAGEREAFDRSYEQEHLPQAATAFQAVRRGAARFDPPILRLLRNSWAAQVILDSDTLKGLIAEFDRVWRTVTRTREVVATRQSITA